MDAIKELLNANWTAFILLLFVIASSLKYSVELYLSIKKILRFKTGKDIDKENEDNRFSAFENRISTLEKHDNWQYNKLCHISQLIEQINKNFVSKEINDLRWELLDFCSALTNGRTYNREAFEHIFRTYENYEKILEENNMTNGYVEESINAVREIYHEKLLNCEFK